MIEIQNERHKKLVSTLKDFKGNVSSENELIEAAHNWIANSLCGTGKSIHLFSEQILLDLGSSEEQAKRFSTELIHRLQKDESLHVGHIYNDIYRIQCKKKIAIINSLPRLQRLMYELRFSSPEKVNLGMAKLNEDERRLMKEVLLYEI